MYIATIVRARLIECRPLFQTYMYEKRYINQYYYQRKLVGLYYDITHSTLLYKQIDRALVPSYS